MHDGPDIATLASLVGDPTRAGVLTALLGDRALSATELADLSRVTRPTMSAHLDKLARAGLVAVERQGRHRYFRLADGDVARVLEDLMGIAARTGATRPRTGPADPALRKARRCYDHLAGSLGVSLYDALESGGAIERVEDTLAVTADGRKRFEAFGIDVAGLTGARRTLCRPCLDWSERRHHLAGALGAALLARFLALRWARQAPDSRVIAFSASGEAALLRFARG